MTDDHIRVCFVALGAYPSLVGKKSNVIVGPDVHQTIILKKLMKYDFGISVITQSEDGLSTENINGMEIVKIQSDTNRLRVVDIVLKVFRMWGGMRRAKADIYFHAGGAAGVTSIFCKFADKKYVYSIASNALVDRTLISKNVSGFCKSRFSLGNFGNWLDIKLADAIIVQNEHQKMMLRKNFGRDGTLIKMPFPLARGGKPEKAIPHIVLWVGAISEVKQPELFVKLAEAIPQARFQMIGGHSSSHERLYDKVKDAAKRISNFEYLGVVPFEEIDDYFSRASILVNTSMFEGFPNAFVQAWMHNMPVVSLNVDPDELLYEKKLGLHSKTFEQMIEDVKALLENEELCEGMGRNARGYAAKEHDVNIIIKKYIEMINLRTQREQV